MRNAVGTQSVSTAFSSSPMGVKSTLCDRNKENMFSISLRKFCNKERKQLIYLDYQKVNSLHTIITSTVWAIDYLKSPLS